MPRANIEHHFNKQEELSLELLKTPECGNARRAIKRAVDDEGRVPTRILSVVLGVPVTSLSELKSNQDKGKNGVRLQRALKALKEYIPKVLKWKSLVSFSKEVGLHRNQVEKIIRDGGSPRMLMYARDKRLYISPEGELQTLKKIEQLNLFGNRPTPKAVAEAHKVPLNLLTSYFSSRGITLEKDPLGKVRLTLSQATMFSEWRQEVAQRAQLTPLKISGEMYEPVKIVARNRAARLFSPNTSEYERYLKSCEASLKHLAKRGKFLLVTKSGAYVPSSIASDYSCRVTVPEAARMIGVAPSTIKAWRRADPTLVPPHIPGRYCLDVAWSPLLNFATQRYYEEGKLRSRKKAPSILCIHALEKLEEDAELDKSGLIQSLRVSEAVKRKLSNRSSFMEQASLKAVLGELHTIQGLLATGTNSTEKDPTKSAIFQARKIGHNAMLLPAWKVVVLVEKIAGVRGCSPEVVYSTMREFHALPPVWPTTYSSLAMLQKTGMTVKPYPLKVGVSLEKLLESYGNRLVS